MSLLLRAFNNQWNDPFDEIFGLEPLLAPVIRSSDEPPLKKLKQYSHLLPVDIIEHDSTIKVHVDLPGVDKSDLDVSFHEGVMTIQAERKEVQETEKIKTHKIERTYGKVQRSIRLPKDVNTAQAEASLKDGVLVVSIPKSEHAQVHKLSIQ